MRYMGGKNKIAKKISNFMLPYIEEKGVYVEPFCGSAKVTECVSDLVKTDVNIFAYDFNEYLISLFVALQNGWEPPKELSEEKYKELRKNPDQNKPLSAFAGFGCSWGGKWFGGYAKCNRGEDFALETYNSLVKQKTKLARVKFQCADYQSLNFNNAVIYCDPPYANTTKYKINTDFDSDLFWEKMRDWSKDNLVFISEYSAPDDFVCVWSNEVKTELRNSKNERETRVEKLFVHNCTLPQLGLEEVE